MRIQILHLALTTAVVAQFPNPTSKTTTTASTARPATSIAIYTPATTVDSWQCATKNISDYLTPPMPTGQLLDIYYEHSDKIYEECEEKLLRPFTTFPACPSIASESWCALSTAVSSSDRAEFRAYTSVASSWWAAHSSALADIREECPDTWESAKIDIPGGEAWLDATEAFADCGDDGEKVEEEVKSEGPAAASASLGSATVGSASASASVTGGASSGSKMDVAWVGLAVAILMVCMG